MKISKAVDETIDNKNGFGWWGYIKHVIANTGNGAGRASRAEYWSFFLTIIGVFGLQIGLVPILEERSQHGGPSVVEMFLLMVYFVLTIPLVSLTARRFHDSGWSGWWAVTLFWPTCITVPGQPFDNAHGPNPKSENGIYAQVPDRTFLSAIREGMDSMAWLF